MSQTSTSVRSDSKEIPAGNPGERKNTPKWAQGKPNQNRYASKRNERSIKTAKGTAFLRRRQVAEQQQQKMEGVQEQPATIKAAVKNLDIFEDFPVLSLEELEAEEALCINALERENTERLQSPEYDNNLSSEFWALEGMSQNRLHFRLPHTNRSIVPSVEMYY